MKNLILFFLLIISACQPQEIKEKQFKPTLALNKVKISSDKTDAKSNDRLFDFTLEAYTQATNYCFYIALVECNKSEKPKVLELKQFGFGSTSEIVNENYTGNNFYGTLNFPFYVEKNKRNENKTNFTIGNYKQILEFEEAFESWDSAVNTFKDDAPIPLVCGLLKANSSKQKMVRVGIIFYDKNPPKPIFMTCNCGQMSFPNREPNEFFLKSPYAKLIE